MKSDKIRIGIIGGTGYTGMELLRILDGHPHAELKLITSESQAGKKVSEVHPQFRDRMDMEFVSKDRLDPKELDLVFLGLPHGVSMDFVKEHGTDEFRIIDLSGDFRLDDPDVYLDWYGSPHKDTDSLKEAVYGLPELFSDRIPDARLIGNPGCYPTASILPLAPLVRSGIVEAQGTIIDAKSGVTGAGAKAKPNTHFPNVNDNFSIYGLKKHRHTPEIQSALRRVADRDVELLFTPHLLPVDRGILTTSYAVPKMELNDKELQEVYQRYYGDAPFVRVVEEPPQLKDVTGSNYCNVFATYDPRTERIITVAVIDNLVKGAAGQAVQNMNLIFGLDEGEGLRTLPLVP
jgi:N-acetyl-gamma-glutamyl-phosphate reductase